MSYITGVGLTLAVFSLLGIAVSGLGYRLGLWGYKAGISIVKYSGFMSAIAVVVSCVGLVFWKRNVVLEGIMPAMVGLILGVCVLAITLKWKRALDIVPDIHDITTDTENPPRFEAILMLRANAENSAVYGGPDVARQQQAAYPDLKPIAVISPPHATFALALQVAQDLGWSIVQSNPQSFRIEATDTTLWFGFIDDVVVRITPAPTGSRIDVRSVSRVGKSDLGKNARRIEAFLSRMV